MGKIRCLTREERDLIDKTLNQLETEQSVFEYNKRMLNNPDLKEEYYDIFLEKFTIALCLLKGQGVNVDLNDVDMLAHYKKWLERRVALLKIYSEFLMQCKLSPNNNKVRPIELSKGYFDSLKKYFQRIDVYSKYAVTINPESYLDGVHPCDIKIKNGKPNVIIESKPSTTFENSSIQKFTIPLNTKKYFTYFVHNPYDAKEENSFYSLLNNEYLDITFGLFGFPKEEMIDEKIDRLRKAKESIKDSRFFEIRMDDSFLGEYHIALLYKPRTKKDNKENMD
jgi:hypothetical protein